MKLPRIPRIGKRAPRADSPPSEGGPATAPAADLPTGEHVVTGHGLDGIRAWLIQQDRQIRLRSIAGALLVGVALAAGAAGIIIATDARDNQATKEDLNSVRTKITSVEQSALQAASEDVAAFGQEIEDLQSRLRAQASQTDRNQSEIRVNGDDIEDLRRDISDLSDRVADVEAQQAEPPPDTGGQGNSGN